MDSKDIHSSNEPEPFIDRQTHLSNMFASIRKLREVHDRLSSNIENKADIDQVRELCDSVFNSAKSYNEHSQDSYIR